MMGDRALEHIRKHPDIWVLSFRFVYGLRTVMPVAIGLSGYPPGRYLLLNGIGAAIWATALAAAAYHFGAVLEGMLGSIKKYELWVLGALLVLGVGLWLRRRFKNARLAKKIYEDEQAAKAVQLQLAEPAKSADPKPPVE
jgi:membrane protein DedA with SNARE-associated domain